MGLVSDGDLDFFNVVDCFDSIDGFDVVVVVFEDMFLFFTYEL